MLNFDFFEFFMITFSILYITSVVWCVVRGLNFLLRRFLVWGDEMRWRAEFKSLTQPLPEEENEDEYTCRMRAVDDETV